MLYVPQQHVILLSRNVGHQQLPLQQLEPAPPLQTTGPADEVKAEEGEGEEEPLLVAEGPPGRVLTTDHVHAPDLPRQET